MKTELEITDLQTVLVAMRLSPDTWVEAYPHGVTDHGDIGGDIQAGDAHGRRFVRFVSTTGLWEVINDAFYLAECDHETEQHETIPDGDGGTETRCKHCGPLTWVQQQTEFIRCRDFRDPGGTEEWADYVYDNTVVDFDYQNTDEYANQCATELQADRYGDFADER